jgi:hypothetical protein
MRFRYQTLSLGVAIATLLLVTPADAHELTKKRAKDALKPVAAELAGTVGPLITQRLPGSSVASSDVQGCVIKKSHRADCAIIFSVLGASTGKTECGFDARVSFKNARSRQLKISVRGALICFFEIPPP